MAAALPLVRTSGSAVTTKQIAEAAGIDEGTIFRVFPDKATLITHVLETALDAEPVAARIRAIDPEAPLASRMVEAVEVLQERMAELISLITALGAHRRPDPAPQAHARFEEADRCLNEALEAVLSPDADQLRKRPADVARLLQLVTLSATHPRLAHGPPLPPSEIVSLVLDVVRDRTPKR